MITVSIIDSDKKELIILTESKDINSVCQDVINAVRKTNHKNIKIYKSNKECLNELISYLRA